MNSRERLLAAINHEEVDRIPCDIWATPEVRAKIKAYFGGDVDIYDKLRIDGFFWVGAEYSGPALPKMPEGESIDYWGMKVKNVRHEGGTYAELYYNPLSSASSVDDLDKYQWPSADWFDYSKVKNEAAELRKKGRAVQCGYMAPFYMHNKLRGLEQSLIDPLENPEFTHELMERIYKFDYEYHKRMFDACGGLVDITQVTDDLGMQSGPMISLNTYKEFYAQYHRKFIDLAHSYGIKVFHHDDGSNRLFLPSLIEMGIMNCRR